MDCVGSSWPLWREGDDNGTCSVGSRSAVADGLPDQFLQPRLWEVLMSSSRFVCGLLEMKRLAFSVSVLVVGPARARRYTVWLVCQPAVKYARFLSNDYRKIPKEIIYLFSYALLVLWFVLK